MTMWAVCFALVIVLGSVKADDDPTGYLFYTAEVINLDSNQTSYTVGCTVNNTGGLGADVISKHLTIQDLRRTPYATEIINDTTIVHKVDLQNSDESTVCGAKSYICRLNDTVLNTRTIYVARPPPVIKSSEFKCISYNRKRLVCQFRRQNSCRMYTAYDLSMIRLSRPSSCDLTDNQTTLSYDSSSDTCPYSNGHRGATFRIEAKNKIGKTESTYQVDYYDIVKPDPPMNLKNSSVGFTSVNITWNMNFMLYNVNRSFQAEFKLITKYNMTKSFLTIHFNDIKDKPFMHQFEDLHAFTNYELKMRLRVIPNAVRYFEDEYWSEWSSISFQTKACRPYDAPRILPGAYSYKVRRDDQSTIIVYWEQVPEYRHNGPGFGYHIYAISESGHKLLTNASNNGVATFQKMRPDDRYTVYLSSHNEEGPSTDVNMIYVHPYKAAYQPKIRKMFQNESYLLQWFPVDDMEDLSNYTMMYCTYSTTGACHSAIKFETIPANATSFSLNTEKKLSFALAANYRTYSSELTWSLCTVSSENSISQLSFELADVTEHSVTVRLDPSCMDRSLIERYDVRYWPKLDYETVKNRSYQPYETVIPIGGLLIDTEYEVVVTAYDEKGQAFEKKDSVRTKSKDILIQLVLFLLFGMLAMGIMTTKATKKLKKIMNIKVEMPIGLLGIDEKPSQIRAIHEFEPIVERSNDYTELVEPPSSEHQPFVYAEPTGVFKISAERSSDTVELKELPPSTYQSTDIKVKSILKNSNQSTNPSYMEHPNQKNQGKPKSAVQIATSNDYIKPAQMPCMVNPAESIPIGDGSSGYVDVNVMMKQHEMVR